MRFYDSSVLWNKKASELGQNKYLSNYVDRFHKYAYGPDPSALGKLNINLFDYSVAIFDARQANTTVRLAQAVWAQNQQTMSVTGTLKIGDAIPWNQDWLKRLPGGSDKCILIIDYSKGISWEIWGAGQPSYSCIDWFWIFKAFGGPNGKAGYQPDSPSWLGVASAERINNIYGSSTMGSRGCGLPKSALTVRADELMSGVINHALPLTISNPMYGMPMANPMTNYLAPGAGYTSGFYLEPARKLEYAFKMPPTGQDGTNVFSRDKTIPSGMRFALAITDANIEAWLAQRGFIGPKKNTARIFAACLREYGAVVAETGGWGVGIECESISSPGASEKYKSLGLLNEGETSANPSGDLLHGLLSYGSLYVVNI